MGGSIKKNNLYQVVINNILDAQCLYVEQGGISANPLASAVYKIAEDNRNQNIDVVIAVGGGSVIDASKAIAALIANTELKSVKELMMNSFSLTKNIPIIAIPTTASTASENNIGSVISLDDVNPPQKTGIFVPCELPILSIEDSQYLATASDWQIAAGIYDTFCHNIEQYFGDYTFAWTKEYLFGNMRNILKYGPLFLKDKQNIEYSDNVLWTATMSLNALSNFKANGYWTIHLIEHGISGVWNVTHGAGNALVTPAFIKNAYEISPDFKEKALELAREVFHVDTVEALVNAIVSWIEILKLPTKWSDFKEIGETPSDKTLKMLADHIKDNPMTQFLPKKFHDYEFVYKVLKSIK